MNRNGASTQRRGGRKRDAGRRRLRPTVWALEDRTLLSMFTVSNTDDSGAGSLRQAILDANASAGADVINFDPAAFATPSTIRLLSSLPDVTGDLTINGPTAARLTISGDANDRRRQRRRRRAHPVRQRGRRHPVVPHPDQRAGAGADGADASFAEMAVTAVTARAAPSMSAAGRSR